MKIEIKITDGKKIKHKEWYSESRLMIDRVAFAEIVKAWLIQKMEEL